MESYKRLENQWNDMKQRQKSDLEKKIEELEILVKRERKAQNWLVKRIERNEKALREIRDNTTNISDAKNIATEALNENPIKE